MSDQRPCTCAPRAGAPRAEAPAATAAPALALRAGQREPRRAQRRPRVVGHLARPDEVPQRLLERLGHEVDVGEQVGEEARARGEPLAEELVLGLGGRVAAAPPAGRATRTSSRK